VNVHNTKILHMYGNDWSIWSLNAKIGFYKENSHSMLAELATQPSNMSVLKRTEACQDYDYFLGTWCPVIWYTGC
jgi:hypothetical protein